MNAYACGRVTDLEPLESYEHSVLKNTLATIERGVWEGMAISFSRDFALLLFFSGNNNTYVRIPSIKQRLSKRFTYLSGVLYFAAQPQDNFHADGE